jgi:adenine-specific DNA-methyltransferase
LWLFYYEREKITTLDIDFLTSLHINVLIKNGGKRPETYIIYADKCALDKEFLSKHGIVFKRIPRDITQF